ncbi:MAG: DUF4405 domain-containing protein [Ruminococcus sp.]|nr:DUF4405 domain-containing protein [Ruminococcus sp.]
MKKVKMTIDLIMVILLPLLMGYSLVGELYHEIIGIAMGVCFITHLVLNRKWFTSLFKGKYNARRIVTTVVNFLLIICVLTSMVSGIFLSKHVFKFLGIHVLSSLMRTLHMLAAYWGLLLMSFHAGTHGSKIFSKLKKKPIKATIATLFLLASAYGVYAFIKREFADFLFGKVMFVFFDRSAPFIFYYLDYLAVIILFMTVGYLVTKLLSIGRRKKA